VPVSYKRGGWVHRLPKFVRELLAGPRRTGTWRCSTSSVRQANAEADGKSRLEGQDALPRSSAPIIGGSPGRVRDGGSRKHKPEAIRFFIRRRDGNVVDRSIDGPEGTSFQTKSDGATLALLPRSAGPHRARDFRLRHPSDGTRCSAALGMTDPGSPSEHAVRRALAVNRRVRKSARERITLVAGVRAHLRVCHRQLGTRTARTHYGQYQYRRGS